MLSRYPWATLQNIGRRLLGAAVDVVLSVPLVFLWAILVPGGSLHDVFWVFVTYRAVSLMLLGTTIGKYVMHVKIVTDDGRTMGARRRILIATFRDAPYYAPRLLYVALIAPGASTVYTTVLIITLIGDVGYSTTTGGSRCVRDVIMRTRVVHGETTFP